MSRTALLDSAISFLRDPSTSTSSLAQRIAFLESKGLTPAEIESALLRAQAQTRPPMMVQQAYGGGRQFERDWRDWFIMAVVGGAVGYVAVKLTKKFILPHLEPPSETDLEASQKALEAKYDEASLLLQTLQLSTNGLVSSLEEQKTEIEKELVEVKKTVEIVKEGEIRRDEESRKIREMVDEVVRGLPNMLEKQALSQSQTYNDLSTELRSLKSLLVARRPSTTPLPSSTATAPPFEPAAAAATAAVPAARSSIFTPRQQGIPAWQLKGAATGAEKTVEKGASMPTPTMVAGPEGEGVGSGSVVLVERPEVGEESLNGGGAVGASETAEQKSEETNV